MMRIRLYTCGLLVTVFALVGCQQDRGPETTRTDSSQFDTLAEKVAFLEQYVTFRRTYELLDFDIVYQNNSGGMVPGPSDWDIRLIATVPEAELPDWVPADAQPTDVNTEWLENIPTEQDSSNITEWYQLDNQTIVGLDRDRCLVAYRNEAH
jgi:hypothetical protein